MKLYGRITDENGLTASIRAMHLQSEIIGITNDNIMGFDKIGYQRKEAVVSSFSEFLGVHGLSTVVDGSVGRITLSGNPLDMAISKKGYFQIQTTDGVKLTRDGRFKLDKEGYLLTNTDEKVLSDNGCAIKLPFLPKDLKDIKVESNGKVSILNKKKMKVEDVATISVVTDEGVAVLEPEIRQGYNEHSNVSVATEFLQAVPAMRSFDANRRLFIMQATSLSSVIQKLSQG